MVATVLLGLLLPFVGTTLGSSCVFAMNRSLNENFQRLLLGFAAGVMIAASVWSLLIPAMNMSAHMGRLAFIPAASGLLLGIIFLFVLDRVTPHLHLAAANPEGPSSKLSHTMMLMLAVTLHNIPEGMAVGVVFAGVITGSVEMSIASAFALSLGIAIQNFPEGAVISMPLRMEGNRRIKSFFYGMLSGVVEPVAALVTILLTGIIQNALPVILSFAAGAMIYVVIEELIPEAQKNDETDICTMGFAVGFVLMMILDVALG